MLDALPTPPSKRKGRAFAAVLSNELNMDSVLLSWSLLSVMELFNTPLMWEAESPLLDFEPTYMQQKDSLTFISTNKQKKILED